MGTLPSRLFNPWRRASSDRFKAFVESTRLEMQALEARARRRKPADFSMFTAQAEALLADLVHASLQKKKAILVHRSKRRLAAASRYRSEIETASICHVQDLLASSELGLATLELGSVRDRCLTRLRPSEALRDMGWTFQDLECIRGGEVLILKERRRHRNHTPHLIDYPESDHTRAMRLEMEAHNRWLASLDISLSAPAPYDLRDRTMRRIFNNGRWDHGGRLYGGDWQFMSKADRFKLLRINEQPVAEVDYRQLFPRMLYYLLGINPPPGDLYLIEGLETHREGVKKLTNSLLFKQGPVSRFPQDTAHLFPPDMNAAEVVEWIRRTHAPIAAAFGTGIGYGLMYRESQLLSSVLRRCGLEGIPTLPVHDASITTAAHAGRVAEVMEAAFAETFSLVGVAGLVEVRPGDRPSLQPP